MDNEVIGTPIKVYRRSRCIACGKCYEYDIENITLARDPLTLICPWCNYETKITSNESYFPLSDDRSVRCD